MNLHGRRTVEVISLLHRYKFSVLFIIAVLLSSCGITATRPKLEMSIAEEAFLSAKDAGGEEISPKEFRLAELSYLKAKSAYKKKFFDKASQYAKISIKYSEMAELNALKIRALGVENENQE
jgi:hypothetical protein